MSDIDKWHLEELREQIKSDVEYEIRRRVQLALTGVANQIEGCLGGLGYGPGIQQVVKQIAQAIRDGAYEEF